jgi:hypothetical protein
MQFKGLPYGYMYLAGNRYIVQKSFGLAPHQVTDSWNSSLFHRTDFVNFLPDAMNYPRLRLAFLRLSLRILRASDFLLNN